jgi:hypothetical protein
MDDEEKKSRWAESLAEAGLLEEIEDGWRIQGEVEAGSVITVDGVTGKHAKVSDSPEPDFKPVPFAVPYPSVPPLPSVPPTPIEDKYPARGRLLEPSEAPTPIDRDYPGPFRRNSSPPIQDMSDSYTDSLPRFRPGMEPVSDQGKKKARSTMRFDEEGSKPISVMKIRGKMVSVVPETEAQGLPEAEICDEPPTLSDPSAILEAIAECRDRVAEMREYYDMGNYSGVVEIAKEVLKKDPQNEEAIKLKKSSEEILMKMYESRIGSFDRAPKMAINQDEVIWRNLDPASGFVLSHIDGSLTFEDVLDISSMSRFETCRILNQLLQDGIIK